MIRTYCKDEKIQRYLIIFAYTFAVVYIGFLIGIVHGRDGQREYDRTYSSEIMYDEMNQRQKGIQECLDALNIWSKEYEEEDNE